MTGTHFGNVRGYKLVSILKLGDSKSKTVNLNGKPATMAHGVVQAAVHGRDGDTPRELAQKLSICAEAWVYPLGQLVADIATLEKDTKYIERTAGRVVAAPGPADQQAVFNKTSKEGDQLEQVVQEMSTEFRQAMKELDCTLGSARTLMDSVSREL